MKALGLRIDELFFPIGNFHEKGDHLSKWSPFVFFQSAIGVLLLSVGVGAQEFGDRFEQESGQADADLPGELRTETSSGGLSELFYRVQVLQAELQELRGSYEEQSYLINRLQRSQKEQYVDLDQRLANLVAGAGPEVSNSSQDGIHKSLDSPSLTRFSDEREAYQYSFDLMRERKYEDSLASFEQLIIDFPNGQYTPNAFYWMGELYLAGADNENARQAFVQVISLYPDHLKVPDALYKLGVVYFALGDNQAALKYLSIVKKDYPESSAAGLAVRYAAEIE